MSKQILTAIVGFTILFFLYHAAEYMILFKNSPLGFLSFQLLFFVAAWLIAKWQRKPGFAAWELDFKKNVAKHLLLGIIMGILLYGITFITGLLLHIEKITEVPALAAMVTPLGLFIFGNFFSSFSEDILTRGYVYNHLANKISNWLLVIISATIYLLNHIYRLGESIETHIYLFLLGVLFVIPLILTKRLWYTGGMHWAGNVTFYFTHEILKAEELNSPISPNVILIIVTLFLIPVNYLLLKKFRIV
jgi:uncharacterized protein